ncbi:hypothetical protein HYH02_000150 [Chlamydomonas schloesseri]|nr:hypothetical protein HYH02_015364 [Chlamydomonas schloesseri]KAG2423482.1 hypothetical protein HYH02_015313 [Chlamydomonas schloesseri]KAG2432412.1 hypothetical protein HYH02_012983 [Chlamydomonas schloesseri]KAG2436530.1 hypothetical protein HYH02_011468 [Chlamydomonas schloesseri]KAG2440688.1 hypothetical protein HYH02_010266 [Chlamydomonas schloesseri]|eukprot:KAG2423162.1 hypothetical protein HYH02_015364 [Chlamydomonas schloesseri]
MEERDDYRVHWSYFRRLEAWFGPHDVDLFASAGNTQLPRFFSRFFCPGSSGVDALAQPWGGLNAYGCPPADPDFLLAVVQKLREERAAATLIVPYWPAQPWWPLLMELASRVVFLPSSTEVFTLAHRGPSCGRLPPWQVAAVRVE